MTPQTIMLKVSILFFCCRPLKCNQCSATFMEQDIVKLKRHMICHSQTFAFTCHICSKKFRRKYDFEKHFRTHLQIRQFSCTYCQQTFLTAEGLRNHIGVHTGARSYKCGLCPMAYNFTASCSQHRRTHLINGKYQCEKCNYEIRSFSHFKMHLAACMPGRLIL